MANDFDDDTLGIDQEIKAVLEVVPEARASVLSHLEGT
jgi:hypothetical protein